MTTQMFRQLQSRQSPLQDDLARIFTDFLEGDRSTRIANFVYQDDMNAGSASPSTGMESWDNVLGQKSQCRQYYVFPNEVELIGRAANEIAGAVTHHSTLVELGTGSPKSVGQKSLPLIHALKPQRYVANDLSLKSVTMARQLVKNQVPGLNVETCQADFLDEKSEIFGYSGANVILTGSTIANIAAYDGTLPVNEVVAYLQAIGKLLGARGSLIVTQDTNHDEQSLKAAYSTPAMVQFIRDMFYRLKTYPGLESFDPSALVYEALWDEKSHLLTGTFVNTKNQTVRVREKTIHIPVGRRLYVLNGYKYPVQDFLHMSRLAGLKPVKTWMDAEDRVALHVLRRG